MLDSTDATGALASVKEIEETQAGRAYRIIEQMIVSMELPPGCRITENVLSQSIGIGRTPVREALQRLALERSVTIHPRSGAVVSDIDLTEQFKLIEVRREVERILVGRSARLAHPGIRKAFAEIRNHFRQIAETNDEMQFLTTGRQFNTLIVRSAENEYAASALAPLRAQTRRLWFLYFQQFGKLAKESYLHADIADEIALNNEATAREYSGRLIDYVEEYTYQTISALTPVDVNHRGPSGRFV